MNEIKKWKEQDIVEFLKNEGLEYQKIQLPFGLSTQGSDRFPTCDRIFGDSINGKSVLDIGSFLGYFCLEAAKRGAVEVVGWEIDSKLNRLAKTIAEINGLPISYIECDVEKQIPNKKYDIVLCLNVLHHMIDPIAVIDKLIELTEEKLVLEVASVGHHDRLKFGLSLLQSIVIKKLPLILVGKGSNLLPYNRQQKYFFTKPAINNILKYHRSYFARIDFFKSDFKNRFLVIAHKRKIEHLIVVSGPTSSGKSTVIRQMLGKRYPELETEIDVDNLDNWDSIGGMELREYSKVKTDGLIFHYDFLNPIGKSARTYDRDEALHILKCAKKITFITIYTKPERLIKQLLESEFIGGGKNGLWEKTKNIYYKVRGKSILQLLKIVLNFRILSQIIRRGALRRHEEIYKLYQDPDTIKSLYCTWLDFIEQPGLNINKNIIIEIEDTLSIYTRKDWAKKY